MKKTQIIGLFALSLMVALSTVGCDSSKSDRLSVGKVDTAILLGDDPQYQSLSIEYMKENTDMRASYIEKMKSAGGDDSKRKIQDAYRGDQQKLDAKWMGKTQEFLTSRHTEIRDTAKTIAEQKGIDVVIIDSEVYPTTEWGGVDITPDMQLVMSQSVGKPAGTPSPGKQGS